MDDLTARERKEKQAGCVDALRSVVKQRRARSSADARLRRERAKRAREVERAEDDGRLSW